MKSGTKTLTMRCSGVVHFIKTLCAVSTTKNVVNSSLVKVEGLTAKWDTGATLTCISQRTAATLGLQSLRMVAVALAHGVTDLPAHIVDVKLPNGLCFYGLTVLECDLAPEDVLIGMDIISQGDFAYSTAGGNSTFSFCVPASHPIDFGAMVGNH